jgi:hypothetical protein
MVQGWDSIQVSEPKAGALSTIPHCLPKGGKAIPQEALHVARRVRHVEQVTPEK